MMPLPSLLPGWTWAAVTVGLMAGAGVAGYQIAAKVGAGETARADARRIECEQARAQDARVAAEKTAALLAQAQDAEAAAARRLAAARAEHERQLKETRRDVYRLTTGRECLSGPLRLRLNAAIAAADDLPESASDADPAHAAPADDAAVAQWVIDAIRAYDECRARIDAIREWDEVTHGR